MFMEYATSCNIDKDCYKPPIVKQLNCTYGGKPQPPVCFCGYCACNPNPPKHIPSETYCMMNK